MLECGYRSAVIVRARVCWYMFVCLCVCFWMSMWKTVCYVHVNVYVCVCVLWGKSEVCMAVLCGLKGMLVQVVDRRRRPVGLRHELSSSVLALL